MKTALKVAKTHSCQTVVQNAFKSIQNERKKISYFDENDTERIRIIYYETPFFIYEIHYTYTPNGAQISKKSYLKKNENSQNKQTSVQNIIAPHRPTR